MEYVIMDATEAKDKGMQLSSGKDDGWYCLASRHGALWRTVGWFSKKETAEKIKAQREKAIRDLRKQFNETMRREEKGA